MNNLIIEVGKFYKTREGQKVKIYSKKGNHFNYPIHGAILWGAKWRVEKWTEEGFYFWPESECKFDIISEWVEPHPAESWEVDKPILVSDDGKEWIKRHFAKYENGHIFAFTSGKTSWTEDKTDLGRIGIYKFAKPAEENK